MLAEAKENLRIMKKFSMEKILEWNELKLNEKEWADLVKKNAARLHELEEQREKDLDRTREG